MRIHKYMKHCLGLLLCIQFLAFPLSACNVDNPFSTEQNENAIVWVREESQFLSYSIENDTVVFSYTMCIFNNTSYDKKISSFGIALSKEQTRGWIKHESMYIASKIGKQEELIIKAGQKLHFTAVFEGEYLGGEPNVEALFPQHLGFIIQ